MHKHTKKILLLFTTILFAFSSSVVFGQQIKIQAPETVMKGEQFRVSYIIESDKEVREPVIIKKMEGFNILYGPSLSTSVSTSFINGKRVAVYQAISVYFLEAPKEGKFTLPKAEVTIDGKKYKSDNFKIEVKATDDLVGDIDAFIKTVVTKSRVNLSDTLTLTYRLYTTKEIRRIISQDFPYTRDFYSSNITRTRQLFSEETIGGKTYKVVDIRKVILQPLSIGQKTIPEGQITVEYATPTGRKVRDMWGDIYDETVRTEKILPIDSVIITVQDLKAI